MMARRARTDEPLPLLVWPERLKIDALEAERNALRQRIDRLPPKSFRRVELEARLRDITAQELKISNRMRVQ